MIALGYIGSLLVFIATIWIVVLAVQNGEIIWAIASFFCFIAAIIYGVQHFEQAKMPLGLWALGFVLSVIGNISVAMQAG